MSTPAENVEGNNNDFDNEKTTLRPDFPLGNCLLLLLLAEMCSSLCYCRVSTVDLNLTAYVGALPVAARTWKHEVDSTLRRLQDIAMKPVYGRNLNSET